MLPPKSSARIRINIVLRNDAEQGCEQRNRHADNAVPVAAARGFLVGKSAEREDKKNRRSDV